MKIKKLAFAFLVAALFMTSCGNSNTTTEESNTESSKTTETASMPESSENEAQEDTKEDNIVRLTTTTSVNDSGLMDYLSDDFTKDTGLKMQIVSKGTGAAIEDAKKGNADVILVHSPSQEQEFMDGGYGMDRTSFMHNYFVIVGPSDDPAGIKGQEAPDAFKAISDSKSKFASRGDESGTNTKEKKLWEEAGVNLDDLEKEDNYNALGQGMGDTLTFASENGAYTLTDLSTFLSMKSDLNLEVLVDQSESLKNVYSIIIVNPDKVSGTNVDNAKKFEDWMTGDHASKLIEEYGKEEYGQPLFFLGK